MYGDAVIAPESKMEHLSNIDEIGLSVLFYVQDSIFFKHFFFTTGICPVFFDSDVSSAKERDCFKKMSLKERKKKFKYK
jgi:hypothetical protein